MPLTGVANTCTVLPPFMRPPLGNNKTGRIRGVAAGEGVGHKVIIHLYMLCLHMHVECQNDIFYVLGFKETHYNMHHHHNGTILI